MRPSPNYPPSSSSHGFIMVILGPMFSGKTTELIRMHDRYRIANKNCVLVKYAGDTRYDPHYVITHQKQKALGTTVVANKLEEVTELLFNEKTEVVAIDEGQFFPDLAITCEQLAADGKIVIVAALNGDYRRQLFPSVCGLLPLADDIKKLTAVCKCGQEASFTFRCTNEKQLEVIGGTGTYEALCRCCYDQKSIRKENVARRCNG